MKALVVAVLLLEDTPGLETGPSLVHLLAVQAALVSPLVSSLIRPPPMLHLRLAEPVDKLMNHIPLGTRAEYPSKARQQLGERGYLHDGISGRPLGFGVDAIPLNALGC